MIAGESTGIHMYYEKKLAQRSFNVILVPNNPGKIYSAINDLIRKPGRIMEISGANSGALQGMRDIAKILDRSASCLLIYATPNPLRP